MINIQDGTPEVSNRAFKGVTNGGADIYRRAFEG